MKPVGIANQSQSRDAVTAPTTPVLSTSTRATAPPTVSIANSLIRGRKRLGGLILLLVVILVVGIGGVGAYYIHSSQVNNNATAAAATAAAATNTATAQMAATQAAINSNLTAVANADNAAATAQVAPTATAVAQNPDPYPPKKGQLAFINSLSQPDQWGEYSDSSFGGACQYTQGAYHISQSKPNSYFFCESPSSYNNFAFEVQMKIFKGDCGGITFRADGTTGKLYDFVVCQDRTYQLYKYVDNTHSSLLPTPSPDNSAINMGLNQTNVIAVVAEHNTISLFINRQQIASVQDNSYTTGYIGLDADANNDPTEVVYSNAKLWTLS